MSSGTMISREVLHAAAYFFSVNLAHQIATKRLLRSSRLGLDGKGRTCKLTFFNVHREWHIQNGTRPIHSGDNGSLYKNGIQTLPLLPC